jgi:hypothetical protein
VIRNSSLSHALEVLFSKNDQKYLQGSLREVYVGWVILAAYCPETPKLYIIAGRGL